ncbi:MAG: ComEC/Rec2 family competence protein [bacterium]
MTKQPCLKVLSIFIFGIILGRYFYLPFYQIFLFLIVSFLFSVFFFIKQKEIICNIFLSLAILSSGFILTLNSIQSPKSENLKRFIGNEVEITGKIADEPKIYPKWTDYDLSLKNINDEEIKGFIRLRAYGGRIFSYNDIVKFKGALEEPPFYLLSEDINAVSNTGGSKVEKIGEGKGNSIKKSSISFKKYIQNLYFYYLPRMESVLISGIVLGGDQTIPEGVQKIFRDTGTVHILAVSGMNVGLIGTISFMILVGILRLPRKIAVIPSILMIWFYSLATGMNPPVVRSAITLTIIFFGYILERENDVLNSLSLAALIILLFNPLALFSISFQLSFICVLSMILIYPELEKIQIKKINKEEKGKMEDLKRINMNFPDNYMGKFSHSAKELFLLSLAIQVGVWPVGAFYFQQVSLISVIANIFVVPLVGIILYLGISMVIFSKISFLVKILADTNWFLLITLEKIVLFFAQLPYSNFHIQSAGLFFILCYYIIILLYINRKGFYAGQKR